MYESAGCAGRRLTVLTEIPGGLGPAWERLAERSGGGVATRQPSVGVRWCGTGRQSGLWVGRAH